MSDDVDMTSARTEGEIESMLASVRKQRTLVPCGVCYYCQADIGQGRIFCFSECRDDYGREQRLKAIAGRR